MSTQYLVVAHEQSPYVTIYGHADDVFTKLANPAVLPSGNATACAFSPDGVYLAVVGAGNRLCIYKRSGAVFTKLTDPVIMPSGIAEAVEFSPDGTYLAVAHAGAPYVTIYKRAGDVFTKLPNPANLPSSTGYAVSWSSDGTYLVVGSAGAPGVFIYKRAADVFTALPTISGGPTTYCFTFSFSPDTTYLAIGALTGDYFYVFKRTADVFTKLTVAHPFPNTPVRAVAFSPNGSYIVVGSDGAKLALLKRSGDVFSTVDSPSMTGAGNIECASFSHDSVQLSITHDTTPFITNFRRVGDALVKLTPPAALPSGQSMGVAVFPPGNYPNNFAPISGHVYDQNGNPIARTVRSYRRDTGAFVESTVSSAVDGTYGLSAYNRAEHYVIVLDDTKNAMIYDHITPTA